MSWILVTLKDGSMIPTMFGLLTSGIAGAMVKCSLQSSTATSHQNGFLLHLYLFTALFLRWDLRYEKASAFPLHGEEGHSKASRFPRRSLSSLQLRVGTAKEDLVDWKGKEGPWGKKIYISAFCKASISSWPCKQDDLAA